MRKFVSALLAAALFLGLAGCGGGGEAEAESLSPAPETDVVVASDSPDASPSLSPSPSEIPAAGEASALNYVIHEYGESDSIVNYSDVFYSTIHFPVLGIESVDAQIRNWAEETDAEALRTSEAHAAEAKSRDLEYSASLEYSYSAYLVKNRFVSVEEMGFFDESSAAHPAEPIKTFNVDLAGGVVLETEQLFYVNKRNEVVTQLTARLESTATAMNLADSLDKGAIAEKWMDNVLLRSDGVDFLFEAGSVLSHSAGMMRVFLSYGDLRTTLTLGEIMRDNADNTPDPALVNPPVVVQEQNTSDPLPANLPASAETTPDTAAPTPQETIAESPQGLAPETGVGLTDDSGVPYATGPPRQLDPDKPMVALTFDDGPSRNTADIIALFEQYGGRGTFFMVGNRIQQYSDITKQVLEQGSEIASHTWDHKKLTSISDSEVRQEFQAVIDVVESITGARPRFVRPPYGAVDDRVKAVGADMNIAFVNWNIDTLDWKTRDAKATYDAIMAEVADGSIVLCHDLHDATGEAMKLVIPELARQGYQMVTVTELFQAKGIDVEAGALYRHG